MVQIHFQANFLPEHKKFKVELTMPVEAKTGKKKTEVRRWVQLMTVAQFIRFAREDDKPLVIGGMTVIVADDDGTYLKPIREYFKEVANSYMKWKNYFPQGGNPKTN